MARKQGQTARSKKTSKQMRAVSTRVANEADVTMVEPAQESPALAPDRTDAPPVTRSASRKGRPYQHRKTSPTARLTLAPTVAMSKAQEYAFIREDLRRLLFTAGVMIVVMIALLVAIGR